jgi:acyl-CoA reductase-like NAD-dependent aldehyde dehydrogenase
MKGDLLELISPIDGSVYAARPATSREGVSAMIARARHAQRDWRERPLAERTEIIDSAYARLEQDSAELAVELAWQMGRPVSQGGGEIARAAERARAMLAVAKASIAEVAIAPGRSIAWEPVGLVLVIAPWNYPWLTATNSVVPALASGNAVILKHSFQTAVVAERMITAMEEAGLPPGVLQSLHCTNETTLDTVSRRAFGRIIFTGSVAVGQLVASAAAPGFTPVTLELGGKDAAYVRADADLEHAIENLADGAFFNSGQSCCGIERIYVARPLFDDFVDGLARHARLLKLGNPLETATSIGPLARPEGAGTVRSQIAAAEAAGARRVLGGPSGNGNYVAPEILVGVDHEMAIMREESFGPVVGVMAVDGDVEAEQLINDSRFGLTASIWTCDDASARALGRRLEVGTVYQNRCDYLDPRLPWSGRGDSGAGLSLSHLAYASFNRPKSCLSESVAARVQAPQPAAAS